MRAYFDPATVAKGTLRSHGVPALAGQRVKQAVRVGIFRTRRRVKRVKPGLHAIAQSRFGVVASKCAH
jgi:hypothetical protein